MGIFYLFSTTKKRKIEKAVFSFRGFCYNFNRFYRKAIRRANQMKFTEAVRTCFQKYATFSGRARRSEYWFFTLFTSLANILLISIFDEDSALVSLFSLAVFVPGLAVGVRRMHDIGRRGTAVLMILVPLVGWIIYLVWTAKDSQPGTNAYGPNPKTGWSGYTQTTTGSTATVHTTATYTPPKPAEPKTYTPPRPVEAKAEEPAVKPAGEEEPKPAEGKRCPDCGNAVPEDAKFCPLCGEKLF